MKPSAYFINVGRGKVADTDALVEALENGVIAGAALDVTEPEPLPRDHKLWTLGNVLLTPHSSCVCDDIQERKADFFISLLERRVAGRRVTNRVDFRAGY